MVRVAPTSILFLTIIILNVHRVTAQFGVLDDAPDDDFKTPVIPYTDWPWTIKLLGRNCSFEKYNETNILTWWAMYFNGSAISMNHSLEVLLQHGYEIEDEEIYVNETKMNATTEKPLSKNSTTRTPATNASKTTTLATTTSKTTTLTTTTRKPQRNHTKPPVPVERPDDNSKVEPRAQDNRPLRQQLDEICFIEEDDHGYLYECSEEQICICLHTSFIVTVPINTGSIIACLIQENNPCVSPHRPDKPYRCHPRLYCDVNGTKLCKPCKNETHPDGCLKKKTKFSSGTTRILNIWLLNCAFFIFLIVVAFM